MHSIPQSKMNGPWWAAFLAVVAIGLLLVAFQLPGTTGTYNGMAYEKDNNTLVYREESTEQFSGNRLVATVTSYYAPDNHPIGKRMLDFSSSAYAPNFKTEDFRTGYVEGAEMKGGRVRVFVKKDRSTPVKEKTMDIPEPVIDGGFNQYIKDHWNQLQKGETLVFNFIIPARLNYYALRATKVEANAKGLKVRVEPNNALYRWLASPILIQYDAASKKILTYEGKSNIADEKGNNLTVQLVYPHKGP